MHRGTSNAKPRILLGPFTALFLGPHSGPLEGVQDPALKITGAHDPVVFVSVPIWKRPTLQGYLEVHYDSSKLHGKYKTEISPVQTNATIGASREVAVENA